MKKLLLSLVVVAGMSQAAHIHSAKYDSKSNEVVLNLTYGGCHLDSFKLDFGACMKSIPYQLHAILDDSQDTCRAFARENDLRFSLSEMDGCRPAELSISTRDGEPVKVSVPHELVEVEGKTIKVTQQAHQFRVNSVDAVIVGQGFPSTHVFAVATFGNNCEVPRSKELISMVQYKSNFETLSISVGNISQRACPAVYQPVTVTIDLGVHTKPNDGYFKKVVVNGIVAK